MRKLATIFSAIALSTVALLPACSTISTVSTAVSTPVCSHTLVDDKAYYAVLAAYNVPAQAYMSADQHGLMTPALKATVKPILQKMHTYVLGAKAAYGVCNTAVLGNYKEQLQVLRDQVLPLIPKV